MIHKEKEEKNFNKASLVEVSFEGAWFTATVLEVIGI
ncbi:hypothetical protein BVRB_010630 [Beta vulgaris subsp. vulgaris]|uniref:Uncharacterized protein n=1 Tax=Beta vulgaris subsp. vulgaris TaxID=3555 RepID=A0A0J8B619_BETVV|nr:hypothetical protein BVRB_010630 [Beta vulgaris subsp. vulgaris]